jgi:hypothetical protein
MRFGFLFLLFVVIGCNRSMKHDSEPKELQDSLCQGCVLIKDTIYIESSTIIYELQMPWHYDSIYLSNFSGCTYDKPIKVINRKGYLKPCLKGGFDFCKIEPLDSFCNIQLTWEKRNELLRPLSHEIELMRHNLRLASLATKNKKDTFDLITEKKINDLSGIYTKFVDTTNFNQSFIRYSYSIYFGDDCIVLSFDYIGKFQESVLTDFETVIHSFNLHRI